MHACSICYSLTACIARQQNSNDQTSWAAQYNTWLLISLLPKGVAFLVFFLSFSNDQTQIQDELRLQLWDKDAAVAPNIMHILEKGVYRELLKLLPALAGSPENALQLAAGPQDISRKGKVGPKLMHHSTQQLLLHA